MPYGERPPQPCLPRVWFARRELLSRDVEILPGKAADLRGDVLLSGLIEV